MHTTRQGIKRNTEYGIPTADSMERYQSAFMHNTQGKTVGAEHTGDSEVDTGSIFLADQLNGYASFIYIGKFCFHQFSLLAAKIDFTRTTVIWNKQKHTTPAMHNRYGVITVVQPSLHPFTITPHSFKGYTVLYTGHQIASFGVQ